MLVLNLACGHDHRFEGWFGSNDDYESQQARGLISCPLCASTEIARLPSAPRLNVSHLRGAAPISTKSPANNTADEAEAASFDQMRAQLKTQLRDVVQQVLARTEDVGERFAEEARRIHYGETEQRGIRGRTSAAEAEALADEGIAVIALPLPPEDTLQ